MFDGQLSIFPQNASTVVVTTCVWVGVWVVTFFHLRFGWTLSGLVVPGYLVPLLLIHPESVVVILIEAMLTYGIVHTISEKWGQWSYWCSLFGRDRFFALVAVSVLVRIFCDGWCWPWLAANSAAEWSTDLDLANRLHSYGLIVVPLIANYFWKPGMFNGTATMLTQVSATYLIVRYGVAEFTNFHLGSIQYLYEDIASSLLASPKSYIILLTTAWLASWMNLRYAWEYSGIMIPALLALQWHAPGKIVMSLVEALVVFLSAKLLLRLPVFRTVTIEGARKLLIFFNLAFVYRILMAWLLPILLPTANLGDYRGYGYLLTTLLAIRFHQSGNVLRILSGTIQVSLLGAVGSSILGFLLTYTSLPLPASVELADTESPSPATLNVEEDLVDVMRRDKMMLYHDRLLQTWPPPSALERRQFQEALQRLRLPASRDERSAVVEQSRQQLARIGFDLYRVQQVYWYLRPTPGKFGRGLYVIDTSHDDGVVIQVPAPLDDLYAFESGLYTFTHLPCRALAVAPAVALSRIRSLPSVLTTNASFYAAFAETMELSRSLQIRGDQQDMPAPDGPTRSQDPVHRAATAEPSQLWVRSSLPQGLDLRRLESELGSLQVTWNSSAERNEIRELAWSGFGELQIPRNTRIRLLTDLVVNASAGNGNLWQLQEPIATWLQWRRETVARADTSAYIPPRLEELLFLDREVVEPLVQLTRELPTRSSLSSAERNALDILGKLAARLGYALAWSPATEDQDNFVVLLEQEPMTRNWGTYVFRCGIASKVVWQTPRPLYEEHSWEFSVAQFLRSDSAALLLAGAHPKSNSDGSADLIRTANKLSLFNLVHQALLRAAGEPGVLVVQTRSIRNPLETDLVLATDDGASRPEMLSSRTKTLYQSLIDMDWTVELADGSDNLAGYELGSAAQRSSHTLSPTSEFATLWVSPSLRSLYRDQDDSLLWQALQYDLGIAIQETSLAGYLTQLDRRPARVDVPSEWRPEVLGFLHNRDILRLRRLQLAVGENHLRAVLDSNSRQLYLLMDYDPSAYPLILLLTAREPSAWNPVVFPSMDEAMVRHFVASRHALLEVRELP